VGWRGCRGAGLSRKGPPHAALASRAPCGNLQPRRPLPARACPAPTCRHALEARRAEGLDDQHLLQLAVLALTEAVGQALGGIAGRGWGWRRGSEGVRPASGRRRLRRCPRGPGPRPGRLRRQVPHAGGRRVARRGGRCGCRRSAAGAARRARARAAPARPAAAGAAAARAPGSSRRRRRSPAAPPRGRRPARARGAAGTGLRQPAGTARTRPAGRRPSQKPWWGVDVS
jgi:hypothetical protein